MSIVIIGWGSLIWDPRDLPHYGPWKLSGPILPIEFSRISSDGRLTLVIDPSGSRVSTRFALSPRTNLEDAVEDLRNREGTIIKRIGYYSISTGKNSRNKFKEQVDINDIMKIWCTNNNIEACVWTALSSNFKKEINQKFSVDNAIAYLEKLSKSTRRNALKYIQNAPSEIVTPVRRKVILKWPDYAS